MCFYDIYFLLSSSIHSKQCIYLSLTLTGLFLWAVEFPVICSKTVETDVVWLRLSPWHIFSTLLVGKWLLLVRKRGLKIMNPRKSQFSWKSRRCRWCRFLCHVRLKSLCLLLVFGGSIFGVTNFLFIVRFFGYFVTLIFIHCFPPGRRWIG